MHFSILTTRRTDELMSYWQRKYSLFIRLRFCFVQEFSNLQTIFYRNHFLQRIISRMLRPSSDRIIRKTCWQSMELERNLMARNKAKRGTALLFYLCIWHFRTIRVFICMFVSRLSEDYFPASVYKVKLHLSELVGRQTVNTIRIRITRARHKNGSSRSDKWMQAEKLLIQLILGIN